MPLGKSQLNILKTADPVQPTGLDSSRMMREVQRIGPCQWGPMPRDTCSRSTPKNIPDGRPFSGWSIKSGLNGMRTK